MVAKTKPEKKTSAREQVHSGNFLVGLAVGAIGVLAIQYLRTTQTISLRTAPQTLMNPQNRPRILSFQPVRVQPQSTPEIKLI